MEQGKVYLVGAGPGDPGLLTLRGRELLGRADVVLYDYLVNPQLLEHAPASAELVCLGRHGDGRIMAQEEINARLVAEARRGRAVVRLKGGDPAVFARTAEELAALRAAGVVYEVVPGVTAALAAGSCTGIPLTHRGLASGVALVTGQEESGKDPPGLDYAGLARFPGTVVFYMGVTTAPAWSAALIEAGKPATTPAAIVRRATLPDQELIPCTLGEVAARLQQARIRPPVVVIVGPVAAEVEAADWFVRRPLFGRTVLVTRPHGQGGVLRARLADLGAAVWLQPAIEIGPPGELAPLDGALDRLGDFDWVVFSSANGVRALLERLLERGSDARSLAGARLACIGPATVEALATYRLRCDLAPETYRAEALAESLKKALDAGNGGRRVMLVRASRGRDLLARELRAAGADVEQVVAYGSHDVTTADPQVVEALRAGRIDWTTVTSSAIAGSLVGLLGDDLRQTRLAAISPLTADALRQQGHEPAVVAEEYTAEGLVEAILRAEGAD